MSEEARAVAEVAKTAGEIVKAAGGVGTYLARIVGSVPDNLIGLAGDWLEHKRRRHLAQLEANTARLLDGIAPERLTEPSPSVLIPLLQASVNEGRSELQALWAALLANAMVDGGKKVRRDYFAVVQEMEPIDAWVLATVSRQPADKGDEACVAYVQSELSQTSISLNDFWISVRKLHVLGCLPSPTGYPVRLEPFGTGLLEACTAPE